MKTLMILSLSLLSFSDISFERSFDKKIVQHINSRRVAIHRMLVVPYHTSAIYQRDADSLAVAAYNAMEQSRLNSTQGADEFDKKKYDDLLEPAYEKFARGVNSEVGYANSVEHLLEKIDASFDEYGKDYALGKYTDDSIVVSMYGGGHGYMYVIFVWPGR